MSIYIFVGKRVGYTAYHVNLEPPKNIAILQILSTYVIKFEAKTNSDS